MILQGKFVAQFDSKIQIKQKEETTVKKESQKSINRKVKSEIDQIEGKITQLVQEQTETGEKLSKVEQTVDGITQRVEHMEDVTNTVSGTKTLALENCVASSLLELHIYGNNNVFKHLYPSDDLLVSDDLIIYGDSRITVTNNGETKTYELGVTEVLRQNEEVRDEYILVDGQVQVTRRVNADGTTKATPVTEDLGEYSIPLGDGTNIIEILNYTASMEAKFALQNDYTELFATKVEMDSSITQTAEEINLEVRKKVDENEIISKINQTAESITIDANRININGTVSANGNFKVDTDGNMSCNNANITGGKVEVYGGDKDTNNYNIKVLGDESNKFCGIVPNGFVTMFDSKTNANVLVGKTNTERNYANNDLYADEDIYITNSAVGRNASGSGGFANTTWHCKENTTSVSATGITTPTLTQTSLAEQKKNFEKLEDNAIEIIKNIDIYKYNLKSENDTDKKHIGFVIGDGYNYSKEVTSLDNQGVDNYSFTSLCCKAIQEQQEIIERLSNEIKELKEGK